MKGSRNSLASLRIFLEAARTLNLAVSPSFAQFCLIPGLREFFDLHPEVLSGLGAAVVPVCMVLGQLRSGELVRPLGEVVEGRYGYFLLQPRPNVGGPYAEALCAWVAGDADLTALISGFAGLEALVGQAARGAGVPAGTWLPLMSNSDHANFARHGIPALRLVAGFGKPDSRVNRILSADDKPGLILDGEKRQALAVTAAMADIALSMSDAQLDALARVANAC